MTLKWEIPWSKRRLHQFIVL